MKTLDEVIDRLQRPSKAVFEPDGLKLVDRDYLADALHYLKHLQEYYQMSREHHEPNPALTWEQLKQMEGKPVWVEHKLFKGWRLVGWQANDHMMNLVGSYSEQLPLFEDDCGKTWQAYRKERSC